MYVYVYYCPMFLLYSACEGSRDASDAISGIVLAD